MPMLIDYDSGTGQFVDDNTYSSMRNSAENEALSRINQAISTGASRSVIQGILADIRQTFGQISVDNIVATNETIAPAKLVKVGNNVVRITEDATSGEALVQAFFDSVVSTEIINMTRHDSINTDNPQYNIVKDVADIKRQYDPNNIVVLQKTLSEYFSRFPISLSDYEPEVGTGPNGETVYVDSDGSLVINLLEMPSNFVVEVQTMTFDEAFNDTIYGGDF